MRDGERNGSILDVWSDVVGWAVVREETAIEPENGSTRSDSLHLGITTASKQNATDQQTDKRSRDSNNNTGRKRAGQNKLLREGRHANERGCQLQFACIHSEEDATNMQ